jgi:hypothetical protein
LSLINVTVIEKELRESAFLLIGGEGCPEAVHMLTKPLSDRRSRTFYASRTGNDWTATPTAAAGPALIQVASPVISMTSKRLSSAPDVEAERLGEDLPVAVRGRVEQPDAVTGAQLLPRRRSPQA